MKATSSDNIRFDSAENRIVPDETASISNDMRRVAKTFFDSAENRIVPDETTSISNDMRRVAKTFFTHDNNPEIMLNLRVLLIQLLQL